MASLKAHVGLHVGRNRDYSFKFLFLRKSRFVYGFWQQTDRRTDRQTAAIHKAASALSRAAA